MWKLEKEIEKWKMHVVSQQFLLKLAQNKNFRF